MNKIGGYLTIMASLLLAAACTYERDLEPIFEDNPLAPIKMTRAQAREMVLSEGVGYGYNGVYGEKCNVPDVRSQVLDLDAIKNAGQQVELYAMASNELSFSSTTGLSLVDILQKLYFDGSASGTSVVFHGNISGTLQLYTEKKINSYFCHAEAKKDVFYSKIDAPSVAALVDSHPEMLTKNFRSAVARLGSEPTKMQMDSLIERYGTHVVTYCTLGGITELDIRLEKDSVATIESEHEIGDISIFSIFDAGMLSDDDYNDLKLVNSGDSRLTVRGGDSRKLEFEVMNFDWGRDAVDSKAVGEWVASIGAGKDMRQNLEMTSMSMIPIWEFIADDHVAEMLEAHITGNAELLMDLYGYQNFVNTSFPAEIEGKYDTYNILSDGRYVATLCREIVLEIDLDTTVWVAYPIYQQEANTATGLCIHNGYAYRVGWQFGEMVVERVDSFNVGNTIYMSAGYLNNHPMKGINYTPCELVPYYEWPGSILTDGTLDVTKPYYLGYKCNNDFYLRQTDSTEQRGQITALPNWSYDENSDRMIRNQNYVYYINPLELEYIRKQ